MMYAKVLTHPAFLKVEEFIFSRKRFSLYIQISKGCDLKVVLDKARLSLGKIFSMSQTK